MAVATTADIVAACGVWRRSGQQGGNRARRVGRMADLTGGVRVCPGQLERIRMQEIGDCGEGLMLAVTGVTILPVASLVNVPMAVGAGLCDPEESRLTDR